MNRKFLISFLLLLLLAVIAFMVNDLYFSEKNQDNPYEYNIDSLAPFDSTLIHYKQSTEYSTGIEEVKGLGIDESDNIYVSGKNGVELYDADNKLIRVFDIEGIANCIFVTTEKKIYLGVGNHIEVFDSVGNKLSTWDPPTQPALITSVVVMDSSVFIANAAKKVVHRYNLDGVLVNNIAEKDSLKGIPGIIIRSPFFDLQPGRDNELWVVNPGRYSLEAYDFDGGLISMFTKASMDIEGFCGCCNPTNIALLSDGCFVTSEKGIERIKILYPSGDLKCVVAAPDQFEKGTRGMDLVVDSDDRIFVLDPYRKTVRIFELK